MTNENFRSSMEDASCIACGNNTFKVRYERHSATMTLICAACGEEVDEFLAYPEPIQLGLIETGLHPIDGGRE